MPVYKKFGADDKLTDVLVCTRRVAVVSSSESGWRSNFGLAGGGASLFGDIRSREQSGQEVTVRPLGGFSSLSRPAASDKNMSLKYPSTASINVAYMYVDDGETTETKSRWGKGHWGAIENLYEWHSRYLPETFKTSSYDDHCLLLHYGLIYDFGTDSTTIDMEYVNFPETIYNGQIDEANRINGMTIEMRTKGTATIQRYRTASTPTRYHYWNFTGGARPMFYALTGSGVVQVLSVTSSLHAGYNDGRDRWHHSCVRITGSTLEMYSDLQRVAIVDNLSWPKMFDPFGSNFSGSTVIKLYPSGDDAISEVRVWKKYRTDAELSASYDRPLYELSSSTDLVFYAQCNDGPAAVVGSNLIGSGVMDRAPASSYYRHGTLTNGNVNLPHWEMIDDDRFVSRKKEYPYRPTIFKVIDIPELMYGTQIATGSLKMTCARYGIYRQYTDTGGGSYTEYFRGGLKRILVDDGMGGVFISGSFFCSGSTPSENASYVGAAWRRVGNVFYGEGLIVLTDPTVLDFGSHDNTIRGLDCSEPDVLSIEFDATYKIPYTTLLCHANAGEFNASNNPTFSEEDVRSGKRTVKRKRETWITGIGVYDDRKRLVGVVKLAQPIRKREKDKILFKVRLDF